jgi:hypothetical protein
MPLGLDFLNQITNVHWGGGLHFLYSGADGMYGSKDGVTWAPAPPGGSVQVLSLAWVDGVWVGTSSSATYRSTDGGKTWVSAGGGFRWVVACKPKTGATDRGGSTKGIFAAYKQDDEGEHEQIYISRDLGQSWGIELDIPTSYNGGEGSESFVALSGCGNGIFVSTQKSDTSLSGSDAVVYSSIDDGGFSKQVVWQGIPEVPGQDGLAYGPGGVGFDSKTQQFCFTGLRLFSTGPGGVLGRDQTMSIIYATGTGGSFAGESVIDSVFIPRNAVSYDFLAGGFGTCGGDGKFATTSRLDQIQPTGPTPADLRVHFIPGAANVLMSVTNIFDDDNVQLQLGPICWRSHSQEKTDEAPTDQQESLGTWCCIAFGPGADATGGVWTAKAGGGFAKTHSGTGFAEEFSQRAGLAVGRLSWLGSTSDP